MRSGEEDTGTGIFCRHASYGASGCASLGCQYGKLNRQVVHIDSCRNKNNKFVCAAIKLQHHIFFIAKRIRRSLKDVRDSVLVLVRIYISRCLVGHLDTHQKNLCEISHQVNSTYPLQMSGSLYCKKMRTAPSKD